LQSPRMCKKHIGCGFTRMNKGQETCRLTRLIREIRGGF
jgi:hypothetical protein